MKLIVWTADHHTTFSLKLIDFKDNITTSFGSHGEKKYYADVTLACKDRNQVDAHKVILAASSPFFQNLVRTNKQTHPLIYKSIFLNRKGRLVLSNTTKQDIVNSVSSAEASMLMKCASQNIVLQKAASRGTQRCAGTSAHFANSK